MVTGLAWRGALAGFGWHVRDMTRFDQIHGSIAAVVVFLIWVYTSAVIFLRRRGDGRQRAAAPPPAGRNPGGAESPDLMRAVAILVSLVFAPQPPTVCR